MADIRQSTEVLDDFQRPDEDPIQHTAAHPWTTPFYSSDHCELSHPSFAEGAIGGTGVGNASSMAAWDGFTMSLSDGVPETWGLPVPPSYSFPEGTRQGLMDASGQGYQIIMSGGFGTTIRRYTGGGAFVAIDGTVIAGDLVKTPNNCLQLLRADANYVEVWRSAPSDFTTWTLTLRSTDTTYRSNLYLVYGSTGNEDGWGYVGGGFDEEFIVDIYRRPFE